MSILNDVRTQKFTTENGWVLYKKSEFKKSGIEPFETVGDFLDYLDSDRVCLTVIEKVENELKQVQYSSIPDESIEFSDCAFWTEIENAVGEPMIQLILVK